jgi:hypothetical protein
MLKFSALTIVKHEYTKFNIYLMGDGDGKKGEKKAPLLRPGQRHLDYGMMFSGHIENQHTIKLKSAGLMEKSWRK